MPASGGGEDDAGQEDHRAGRDPGEETWQHDGPGDRSDAERAQQEPVAAGPQTQEPAGDEREQRPQGRARQDEQCRPEQEPADHPRVAYVAGAGPKRRPEALGHVAGDLARRAPSEDHQSQDAVGRGVDGEHQPDVDLGDQETGEGGTDGSRQIHAHRAERGGRTHPLVRNDVRNERLPGRHAHRLPTPDQEGEGEEHLRRYLAEGSRRGENPAHHEGAQLDPDEEPPAVEGIGEDAGRQGQQQHRQQAGRLHEGDQGRRVGFVDQQPLGADRLHPRADHARQLRQPERPEGHDPERGPSRGRVGRHRVCVGCGRHHPSMSDGADAAHIATSGTEVHHRHSVCS